MLWHALTRQTGLHICIACGQVYAKKLWLQGDVEGALRCYQEALKLLPTKLDALAWLAAWYTDKEASAIFPYSLSTQAHEVHDEHDA